MICPVCRATNDQGPQCRRCKADLGLLFRLEAQRKREAVARLLRRDFAGAWRLYQETQNQPQMNTDKHR